MHPASNSPVETGGSRNIGSGAVTGLRVGDNKRVVILDEELLEFAGIHSEVRLTGEVMPDGSIVLRRVPAESRGSYPVMSFEAALEEDNRRFGGAFQRLAK